MLRSGCLLLLIGIIGCRPAAEHNATTHVAEDSIIEKEVLMDTVNHSSYWVIGQDIPMRRYFEAIDSLCALINAANPIAIDEYTLVHANPWIIDSLRAQDYYRAKTQGQRIDDQKNCIPLHAGDSLRIPLEEEVRQINAMLKSVTIDVNIPEFTLRIQVDSQVVHTCPVRVGKNERKYLELARHEVNLRTPIGEGSIIRIERDPLYINPVDGHRYKRTRRDDGHYTELPRIPFLEPEINGIRSGALIHPTTNPSTLGKAISNGCVGLSEADAWLVYYHAPMGTPVQFRYDLMVNDSTKRARQLPDIYGYGGIKRQTSNDHPID
jgi:L,D-transpeptidase ErfK/SrfK